MKLSDSASEPSYLESSLGGFFGLVSSDEPAPAGGSVAAAAAGLAAALCVKAALLSTRQMSDALDIVAAGELLRDRAGVLCQADADAYRLVIEAMRLPREPDARDRRRAITVALKRASDVAAEIAEIAADVADVAARIAEGGNPNLLGDVVTAALLAEASARSAAALVRINLEGEPDVELIAALSELLEKTAQSSARARRVLLID